MVRTASHERRRLSSWKSKRSIRKAARTASHERRGLKKCVKMCKFKFFLIHKKIFFFRINFYVEIAKRKKPKPSRTTTNHKGPIYRSKCHIFFIVIFYRRRGGCEKCLVCEANFEELKKKIKRWSVCEWWQFFMSRLCKVFILQLIIHDFSWLFMTSYF